MPTRLWDAWVVAAFLWLPADPIVDLEGGGGGTMDSVDATRLPWPFSQQPLLTSAEFCRVARDRGLGAVGGITLDDATLRALYRRDLVKPLLEVRTRRVRDSVAEPLPDEEERALMSTDLLQVRRALKAGRLADPDVDRRRDPPRFGRRVGDSLRWWNGLLYSSYQLLALSQFRPQLERRRYAGPDFHRVYLEPAGWDDADEARRLRRLTIALTVLETRYRPEATHSLSGLKLEQWERYRAAFDPTATLAALGWQPQEVVDEAERLLGHAHKLDPLGDWGPLVRRAPGRMWSSLRGDARLAVDHHIGGEMLLLFYEDLERMGAAPRLPTDFGGFWHPRRERLGVPTEPLDQRLSRLGISPHPRVLLVVEGETEEYLTPAVFDALEIPHEPEWVRTVVMRSVDADLTKLAAFASAPLLGERQGDDWLLIKPPTRLMVAVDPEGGFETVVSAEAERQKILREIRVVLAAQVGVPEARLGEVIVLDDLDELVSVHRWDGGCFEFAHFTNEHLADALLAIHRGYPQLERDDLVQALQRHREHGDDIKQVWANWRPKPSKRDLARQLQPELETQVERAFEDPTTALPQLAQLVWDGYRIAKSQPAGMFLLKGRSQPTP
jgi:hypothetical protein